ncbi:hypothetical protein EDB81DRAFT_872642 [Dactylonectria macrodidyma]|uniref:Uncharacterized protein n=1 Tax=Dactylonectria macrodidyma TaxID=307937 RepID=A0A9P9DLS5_9HYPO|nr:hypothetical protein EDB81DRAFT_872642 [Dactylonectria macrodidyma]
MVRRSNHGTETTVLRKFGINETYQLATYLIDQYRGTCLSCRYTIPPRLAPAESRAQLEEAVKIAVVDIIMRHPMLQVGMMDATSKTPSWIQLQKHDDFEQTPGWKMTIFRQGNAPIMEVLLTWNHPQFGGAGAKVFHEDFLEMLNAENGTYERTGLDIDLKVLAKAFWEETRPQFLNRDVSWAAWCPIRTSPYKTQYRTFFMDNASLVAILARCRQNKTTITGLLNGLALIAVSSRLDSTVAPAFQSSTIMDHRWNLPSALPDAPWVRSDRAVGNYVTQCLHRYDTELLWAVSAQNRQEIVDKLEAGLRNDLVGLFKYVTDWQKTMSSMAKKTRQFTWLVTNIGALDGNTSTGLSTTTTPSPTGGDSKSDDGQRWSIDRAHVAGQGMCVSANWPDCAIDEAFGENIMADLERWLAQLASL